MLEPAIPPPSSPRRGIRDLPGFRVVATLGDRAPMTALCLLILTFMAIFTIAVYRPDLAGPQQIGSDPSNYYAAGQRLNAGHELYALQPGDRPVGLINAANPWKYPLMSPPPIAVLWRPIALLGDLSMTLWWAIGALAISTFLIWLSFRSRPRQLGAVMLLAICCSVATFSGNLNAYLIPLTAFVWVAQARGRSGLAGIAVGVASILKLMPLILVWWLILRRDWRAVGAFAATIGIGALLSILGAGFRTHLDYLAVAREANSVLLSPFNPIQWVGALGVPHEVALFTPYALAALFAVIALAMRHRPGLAFAACIAALTFGTPDLRMDTYAWLTVALVPFATEPNLASAWLGQWRRTTEPTAVSAESS